MSTAIILGTKFWSCVANTTDDLSSIDQGDDLAKVDALAHQNLAFEALASKCGLELTEGRQP